MRDAFRRWQVLVCSQREVLKSVNCWVINVSLPFQDSPVSIEQRRIWREYQVWTRGRSRGFRLASGNEHPFYPFLTKVQTIRGFGLMSLWITDKLGESSANCSLSELLCDSLSNRRGCSTCFVKRFSESQRMILTTNLRTWANSPTPLRILPSNPGLNRYAQKPWRTSAVFALESPWTQTMVNLIRSLLVPRLAFQMKSM